MPIKATVSLDTLHCIAEYDKRGHSEPYIWVTYYWVDGVTVSNGQKGGDFVGTYTPRAEESARRVFGRDVRAGDVINVPRSLGRFTVQLADESTFRTIGVVVALLEEDQSPEGAMQAGHAAFGRSFHRELNDFISKNLKRPNPQERQEIADTVKKETRSAISGAYTWSDKVADARGANRDDFIDFDSAELELPTGYDHSAPIALSFESHREAIVPTVMLPITETPLGWTTVISEVQEYGIQGGFSTHRALIIPPFDQQCRDELQAVLQAEADLEGIFDQMQKVEDNLRDDNVEDRDGAIDQLDQLQKEFQEATLVLSNAKAQLDLCRSAFVLTIV